MCPIWRNCSPLRIERGLEARAVNTVSFRSVSPLEFPCTQRQMEEINETCYIHGEPGASNVAVALSLAEQSVAPWKVAVSELPTGGHLQWEDPSQDASPLRTPVPSEHPNHTPQVVSETDDCAPQTRHLFIFMYLALLRLKWVSWSVCVPTQPSG